MPRGAGLVLLAGLAIMVVMSAGDSPDYLRVTEKTELPGCHQLYLSDLDHPEKSGPTCVTADQFDYYQVGWRYLPKP